ncbi:MULTISPECIES: hypothetical protein [unclassified Yoonia]|uniref:hypothetical protein n=1 Tax=unclassified Yoonia TaxID=2629118 RepID=UPI002AFEC77C|nr:MULTISPECIES: hypothetical protein [unclassified Yoonia]
MGIIRATALHDVLAAHEYLRMRQLDVDLVVMNDRASSYVQDMQVMIEVAVRSAQLRPRSAGQPFDTQCAIHTLRADLVTEGQLAQLLAVAHVTLLASRGTVGAQLDGLMPVVMPMAEIQTTPVAATVLAIDPPIPALEFFNGTGGFAEDGREYVTILSNGATTPAPWINVIANPGFGFQVSAEGSGSVWAENSRENQIMPWSNDPVSDPAG